MTDFKIHTTETAPDAAKPLLENSQQAFGMVPNLHGVFAESPPILEAYKTVGALFGKTSLTAIERNVVWMTINVEHSCHYCVPAHTVIARSQGVDEATIKALRAGTALPDAKLEVLRQFTLAMVRARGEVGQSDLDAFFTAGYSKENVFDVLLGVSHKVMSNYANHFAKTPVDPAFAGEAWEPAPEAV